MSRRWSRLGVVLVLLLVAAGCGFKRPTLRFKTVNLRDIDLGGTNLEVVYTLHNPNPLGLRLAEVSYALDVEGRQVLSGKPPHGLAIPASGSADLVFPARVEFQSIAPTLEVFLTKDRASYRASGQVGFDTPLGVLRFPISHEDTFPVPKVPQVQLQTPSVRNVTFTGARVVFPVTVTNRNFFPLPVGGFSANVQISGASVGTVQAPLAGALAPGEVRQVEIPLDLSFVHTGAAVAQAVRTRRAQVRLEGALRSGGVTVPVVLSQQVNFQ
jgi:LEA14-like dessication related protein